MIKQIRVIYDFPRGISFRTFNFHVKWRQKAINHGNIKHKSYLITIELRFIVGALLHTVRWWPASAEEGQAVGKTKVLAQMNGSDIIKL